MCMEKKCVKRTSQRYTARGVHMEELHIHSHSATTLQGEINISADSMNITSIKASPVTAQPEARSTFMSGARQWYWWHAKVQSMEVNGVDMQCNVR